jgi:hypothetical protein
MTETIGNTARKPRCRMLDRIRNPCPNPAIFDDPAVCLHHAEAITLAWCDRLAELFIEHGGEDTERLLTIVGTLRRYSGGK